MAHGQRGNAPLVSPKARNAARFASVRASLRGNGIPSTSGNARLSPPHSRLEQEHQLLEPDPTRSARRGCGLLFKGKRNWPSSLGECPDLQP